MIIVTGGAGFIGSALIWRLNELGYQDIVIADRLGDGEKWQNLAKRQISFVLHKDQLFDWLNEKGRKVDAIFHMGACSATTERAADYLMKNNVQYSMRLFEYCAHKSVPFIYASSAATYGAAESGFSDDVEAMKHLRPINKYGYSKQLFDRWAMAQNNTPPLWIGLKFFNVYGPQEYHKDAQASVVYHAFPQVRDGGRLRLFKSYKADVPDGDQKRDFVYVKDVVNVMTHVLQNPDNVKSGIYNLGTGVARTFADLARAVFSALDRGPVKFEWIEMPESLKHQYQYFTQANLENLQRQLGYSNKFATLEDGIRDYVQNYLITDDPYL